MSVSIPPSPVSPDPDRPPERAPSSGGARIRLSAAWSGLWAIVLVAWIARFGPLGPRLDDVGAVGELGRVSVHPGGWIAIGLTTALVALAVLRARPRHLGLIGAPLLAAAVVIPALSLVVEVGHLLAFLVGSLSVALLAGLQLPLGRARGAPRGLPFVLWALVAAIHALFSMHRHWAFGSGSWDLGCMVHNFHRASRGLDTVSTVLGGTDFLGDHFMVGIYLLAPIFWLDDSAYTVLAVQSVSLAASAPAVYAVARAREVPVGLALALGLATGLGFGMQSAAYFDAHAITVGFGFLAGAVWALETGRLRAATAFLVVLSLFKESLGAYVVGFGLLVLWRALRTRRPTLARYGASWIAYGALCFVVVNRALIPLFEANGRARVPHETFADFGPTVFSALGGILADPLKALGAMFVPEEKALSLAVTGIGVGGGLVVLAPEIGLAALPLFAERFLSSKATMWQMGYHYAAPLTLYAGWAAALAAPVALSALARVTAWLEPSAGLEAPRWAGRALSLHVLLVAGLVNGMGYRHPANFHVWREPYFSSAEKRADNAAAVRFVEGLGPDAKVAAQNRILPHLADRADIWRLGDRRHADVVVLSIGESAWPYPEGYPQRLAEELERSEGWRRAFEAGTTRVYVRASVEGPKEAGGPAAGPRHRARERLGPSPR